MTECVEWTGSLTWDGYGAAYSPSHYSHTGRPSALAHRMTVAAIHGWDAIKGKVVAHKCDNRKCVRYGHLFITDRRGNSADMVAKGRQARGETHGAAKLNGAEVAEIKARYNLGGVSMRELAKEFGVSHVTIGRIIRNERWAHVQ